MKKDEKIPLFNLLINAAETTDLMSAETKHHHVKTAYIALSMAKELKLATEQQIDILISSCLYDIGIFSLKNRKEASSIQADESDTYSEISYRLLKDLPLFSKVADIVKHRNAKENVPQESKILHISDKAAFLAAQHQNVLNYSQEITKKIKDNSPAIFEPEYAEAFLNLTNKESFWLDLESDTLKEQLLKEPSAASIEINYGEFLNISSFFAKIVDFRSSFTATHSFGVSACASAIAKKAGFDNDKAALIEAAGYLHDLGKLSVPGETLQKTRWLIKEEFNLVKAHPYHTYRILNEMPQLKTICQWASYHHERIDGRGYPFHLTDKELPDGSRIMAIADIFTALTEDRPYRKSMNNEEAVKTIKEMSEKSALDKDFSELLSKNYEEIASARISAQNNAQTQYFRVLAGIMPKLAS